MIQENLRGLYIIGETERKEDINGSPWDNRQSRELPYRNNRVKT